MIMKSQKSIMRKVKLMGNVQAVIDVIAELLLIDLPEELYQSLSASGYHSQISRLGI